MTVFDRETNARVGFIYVCHGCGDSSALRKRERLPKRWKERLDPRYNKAGYRTHGSGLVVNYYCGGCVAAGVTARTVACTERKCRRIAAKLYKQE